MSVPLSITRILRIILIAVGIGFLAVALRDHVIASKPRSWAQTTGTISSSFIAAAGVGGDRGGPVTTPIVTYRYQVASHTFVGSTIKVGDYLPWPPARTGAYPKGALVVVHYDVDDPQHAVLDRSYPKTAVLTFSAFGLIALLSALLLPRLGKAFLKMLVPPMRKHPYETDI